MSGTPVWQTVLPVAGTTVVSVVAIVVTARMGRSEVRAADRRTDVERTRQDERHRYQQYLALARTVVEAVVLKPPGGRVRLNPDNPHVLMEPDTTRLGRIALDCLPVHYFPLHRILLGRAYAPGPTDDELAADPNYVRNEARATLQYLLAGQEPPPASEYTLGRLPPEPAPPASA